MRKALISAVQFLIVFALFIGAIFCIALPYLPQVLERLIHTLSAHPETCTRVGTVLLGVTLFLFSIFYSFNRHRYLVIQMGSQINLNVIRQAVEDCFEEHFSKRIALKEVEICKSRLEFTISFKPTDETSREELYVKVEEQLSFLLQKRFGLTKPFNVIAIV